MTQPPSYNRSFSFTNYQAVNPTGPLPGTSLDVELNAIKQTLDAVLTNLVLAQNDDGTLKNLSVGLNQLSTAIVAGFNPPKAWLTGTVYTASPSSTVFQSSKIYTCLVSHTAGTFATDLSAGKWQLILDLTAITIGAASAVSFTPAGGLSSTDVQSALAELGNGKANTSHTHASSAISDSTSAGRALLTAANVAAQQTLLNLGSLAFLNTVAVTAISAQLAFTGVISPAALSGNTNDWAPTNLGTSSRVRLSSSGAVNLTGITAQSDGTRITLENIGSNVVTLTNQDSNSSAANRIILPYTGGYKLLPGECLTLEYDGTTSRWRLLGHQAAGSTVPNIQTLLSGTTATYTTATDANGNRPLYLRVRMQAAGGGGGAGSTNSGNNGTDSSFSDWTAAHGAGGTHGTTGAGGAGGTGGSDGTGTKIRRLTGQAGVIGSGSSLGGIGGSSSFGGGGLGNIGGAGTNAVTNTGSGGGGSGGGGGGGGAGEYVEFLISSPAASYTYTVGAKGTGGAAGGTAGADGADGRIEVEGHWQ